MVIRAVLVCEQLKRMGLLPGLSLELLVDSLLPSEVIGVVTHLLFISNFILL